MKYLYLHNVSIHIFFFYQNRFINECVRKTFLNFCKDVKTERRKDGFVLWEIEELTFLIRKYNYSEATKYWNI